MGNGDEPRSSEDLIREARLSYSESDDTVETPPVDEPEPESEPEELGRVTHESRQEPGVVEHGVPRVSAEHVQSAVPIANQRFDVGEEPGVGSTTIEQRDAVAAFEGVAYLVRADKPGTSEDEDSHGRSASGRLTRR